MQLLYYTCTEIQCRFTESTYDVNEGDGCCNVMIELVSGFLTADKVISLATSDGMATDGTLIPVEKQKNVYAS